MPTVSVLDSTMYYEDSGHGPAVVFLHGNPASSHLWRNVLPQIGGVGRLLAPDLIGMGRSGKPSIAYGFADSARYLDAWFEVVGLTEAVLVGHDWGGVLAMDWAARHTQRVRGVAVMETILRPMTWSDFPGPARPRIEALRTLGVGETKVLDENFFMEVALRATVRTPLNEMDIAIYRAPYPTRESRRPLLAWPRALPIEGEPTDVTMRVKAYDDWLAASAAVPKLLLVFDGSPETLIVGEEMITWCRANVTDLEIENCGPANHLAPEDQPERIGDALAQWLARHNLLGGGPVYP